MGNLTGFASGFPFPTSEVVTAPAPIQVGTRARDNNGSEFVFVNYTSTVYSRQPVAISSDFSAAAIGATHRGPIGVAQGGGTSDNFGWVQVYGRTLMQIGMSGVSPSDAANGPTTLSTSAATLFKLQTSATSPTAIGWTSEASAFEGYVVDGLIVATDASPGDVSATTSATSHTGSEIAVFLNYPSVRYEERTT